MGSRAWAEQMVEKERAQMGEVLYVVGSSPGALIQSCISMGKTKPQKTRTIPKATQYTGGESRLAHPCNPVPAHTPWVFHMLGEDRTERHRTVCAAMPNTAEGRGEGAVGMRLSGSFDLHKPKNIFCPPWRLLCPFLSASAKAGKEGKCIY